MNLNKSHSQLMFSSTHTAWEQAKHEPEQADYKCARDVIPENVLSDVGVSAVQPCSRSFSSCSTQSPLHQLLPVVDTLFL